MANNEEDAAWFRRQLEQIFGPKGQTSLARFMIEAGDPRPLLVILRSIQHAATGRNRVSGEMRALIGVICNPHRVPDMLRLARREPAEPKFKLLPAKPQQLSPDDWGKH